MLIDYGYFALARAASYHSEFPHRYRLGAVICNKKPVAIGFNKYKTSSRFPKAWSIHAEMSAIINCRTDVYNGDIWIYRETSDEIPALAKPCERLCLPLLAELGIARVFYTISEPPYYSVIYL